MKRMMVALVLCSLAADARADVVNERVVLVTGTSTCGANALGFKRVKQMPDGTYSNDSVEFQVPYGSYLEITNVEYFVPGYTRWAGGYTQSIDVNVKNRSTGVGWNVFSARFGNHAVYAGNDYDGYTTIEEVNAPGADNRAVAFPIGPLMGSTARLCAQGSQNYWVHGGHVRVRGRLIPSGEAPVNAPPSSSTK